MKRVNISNPRIGKQIFAIIISNRRRKKHNIFVEESVIATHNRKL